MFFLLIGTLTLFVNFVNFVKLFFFTKYWKNIMNILLAITNVDIATISIYCNKIKGFFFAICDQNKTKSGQNQDHIKIKSRSNQIQTKIWQHFKLNIKIVMSKCYFFVLDKYCIIVFITNIYITSIFFILTLYFLILGSIAIALTELLLFYIFFTDFFFYFTKHISCPFYCT